MMFFFEPTNEHIHRLSGEWCCSYSGGKDSTSLVTWIEWLRRTGQITVESPKLVQSDTGVEDAALMSLSAKLTTDLKKTGWTCAVVKPAVHEKLYNRILGIGNTPVHPGGRTMRWCTRSTKIDPMDRWRKVNATGLVLTGRRIGESAMRDAKINRHGCSAGGECGIPEESANTYDPILRWTTCQVIDWLRGHVGREVVSVMQDFYQTTAQLVELYGVIIGQSGLVFSDGSVDPEVVSGRFGCYGCPAISSGSAPKATVKRNGTESPLNELHDVIAEARMRRNRCYGSRIGKEYGPVKMEVRKRLFERVMDIQRRAGVVLITPSDARFIRKCWRNKVYPRGWREEDELVIDPAELERFPLFEQQEDKQRELTLP